MIKLKQCIIILSAFILLIAMKQDVLIVSAVGADSEVTVSVSGTIQSVKGRQQENAEEVTQLPPELITVYRQKTAAPKTGDFSTHIGIWLLCMSAAGGMFVLISRSNKKYDPLS